MGVAVFFSFHSEIASSSSQAGIDAALQGVAVASPTRNQAATAALNTSQLERSRRPWR
jgi:hypothetical protein